MSCAKGVQGICDLVTVPGLINLDLADVRTIMTGAGTAHMGIGAAVARARAQKAAEMAVNSSLLETSIEGARGILLNISGGKDLSLFEVNEVAEIINAACDPEANIIFGAVVDERLGGLAVGHSGSGWIRHQRRGNHGHEQVESLANERSTGAVDRAELKPLGVNGDRGARRERTIAAIGEEPGREVGGEDLEIPSFLR